MSLKETLSLAHTAQCKLHLAANRPDRNLRFVLGHALTLDNLTLRLVEIEEETSAVQQPKHASGVKFKAAGGGSTTRKRSPPPSRLATLDPDDVEDEDEEDDDEPQYSSESDQDELALTRFPSGSSKPTRQPAPPTTAEPPPLDPSDDSSSSDEDEPPALPPRKQPDEETLRKMMKGEGDQLLVNLYNSIKKCPCHGHQEHVPELTNLWAIPEEEEEKGQGRDGIRVAVAEIRV